MGRTVRGMEEVEGREGRGVERGRCERNGRKEGLEESYARSTAAESRNIQPESSSSSSSLSGQQRKQYAAMCSSDGMYQTG